MTNEEIVLELQQGNKENFGILYENTINYSLCVARKYLGNRDMDVDDVIQDSYVSALKHINELEDRTKFDKWLGRIIAHRALNWKRDKLSKVYELTIDDDEDPMDFKDDRVDYNPSLVVDKKATAEIVNGVLSEIPEAQRDVLIMYYGQQYSIKEISNIVGKPENTIKTWLRRGRQNVEAHKQDFIKQDSLRPIPVSSIKLSGISKKIAAGKKIRLKATVLPVNADNKKIIWKVNNTKLASVSTSGLVKIKKKKTANKTVKVIATAKDGSGVKAVWKIRIMKGAVKKIKIKGVKKKLKVGRTMKLRAIVKTTKGKANKKILWISSNKDWASVSSSGKVKASKAGKGKTVTITASATDGSGIRKSVKIKIR